MTIFTTPNDFFIIAVDPHTQVCEALSLTLESWGFRVLALSSIEEAEHHISCRGFSPDLVLFDAPITQSTHHNQLTYDFINFIKHFCPHAPVIIMTGNSSDDFHIGSRKLAWSLLLKPFSAKTLFQTIMALSEWRIH